MKPSPIWWRVQRSTFVASRIIAVFKEIEPTLRFTLSANLSIRRIKPPLLATCALSIFVGCGGGVEPRQQVGTPSLTATPGSRIAPPLVAEQPCAEGRLLIGDLALADAALAGGVSEARKSAVTWQPDARLVALRLNCPLFEAGLEWEGTFYSDSAQAYYSTDTGETEPTETDPEAVPTLNMDGVTFQVLHLSLLRAGYPDSAEISPVEGIIVRLNSDAIPFGPSSAPRELAYFHVAIEERGFVRDLFVSTIDGAIYRYQL